VLLRLRLLTSQISRTPKIQRWSRAYRLLQIRNIEGTDAQMSKEPYKQGLATWGEQRHREATALLPANEAPRSSSWRTGRRLRCCQTGRRTRYPISPSTTCVSRLGDDRLNIKGVLYGIAGRSRRSRYLRGFCGRRLAITSRHDHLAGMGSDELCGGRTNQSVKASSTIP